MKNTIITTAIPYMNGAPHIGHALEIILSDVIVRGYGLLYGRDSIFFLTGADEHGSKIQKTSETQGVDIMTMLNNNVQHFQDMNTELFISNDGYIRTTDKKRHWPIVQALWMKLVEKGDIYKKTYAGWYCDREERFVTEDELDENKCLKENGASTRWTEDENYFFRLSKYSDVIKRKLENNEVKIIPEFRKNEMIALIGNGLEDVSFSRTKKQLTWGIPVPNDADHVMYVWCDALANYISGALLIDQKGDRELSPEYIHEIFKDWSCEIHIIGKDIARFHCLTWIGMLLSADMHLPRNILIHGFVNDKNGAKMSKSIGNVIDPHTMVAEYGSDTVRLYMVSEVGVGQDLNFSDERIKSIHNDVLANNYGNLVNRVLSLWMNHAAKNNVIDPIPTITPEIKHFLKMYEQGFQKYDTQFVFAQITALLSEANIMLNTSEPWKKPDEEKGKILVDGIIYVYYATLFLSPFIPEATNKVMKAMGIAAETKLSDPISINLNSLQKPDILFVKK